MQINIAIGDELYRQLDIISKANKSKVTHLMRCILAEYVANNITPEIIQLAKKWDKIEKQLGE